MFFLFYKTAVDLLNHVCTMTKAVSITLSQSFEHVTG